MPASGVVRSGLPPVRHARAAIVRQHIDLRDGSTMRSARAVSRNASPRCPHSPLARLPEDCRRLLMRFLHGSPVAGGREELCESFTTSAPGSAAEGIFQEMEQSMRSAEVGLINPPVHAIRQLCGHDSLKSKICWHRERKRRTLHLWCPYLAQITLICLPLHDSRIETPY